VKVPILNKYPGFGKGADEFQKGARLEG